ncbi:MAG: cytochrome P450 [Nitrososphaerota archaeon]|nr:cytochrome P450 [Nitrososphaerota archaeon]
MTKVEAATKTKTSVKSVPSLIVLPVGSFLLRNLSNIHKKFPDIAHLKLGVTNFYLITNPDLVQEVLVTKQRDFMKGKYLQRTKKVFGEGLLTSEGDFHHRQRRLVQPAFHHERLNTYAKIMTEYTFRVMSGWKNKQILDIHAEMMRLTMSIVAKCLFDADVESDSIEIARDLTTTIEYFTRLSSPLSGVLQKLPTNRKYDAATARIDKMVYRLIGSRRRSGKDVGDLMSMLLQAKDDAGEQMTDRQLRDEVLILFAAGHETTANALTWTWYLLSENPKVESKLQEEVDSVISKGSLPITGDIPKLEYTRKVFTESMRLYPPAWVLVREALKDCEIGGYMIPKGSDVVISQYVNHHDPRYFPDPERFDPDRWKDEVKLPKFAYFPFGGGSRSCVGEPFAWMEGVLLLATISRNWSMRHVQGHKVEMLPRITLRPKYGMKMELFKREWKTSPVVK